MKLVLIVTFITSFSSPQLLANETWDKTKKVINESAEKIDEGTRKVIKKGKEKMKERKERKEAEKRKEDWNIAEINFTH